MAPPPPPSLPPALPPVPALAPPQLQDITLLLSDADDDDDDNVEDQLDPVLPGQYQSMLTTSKDKLKNWCNSDGNPGYAQAMWALTCKSKPLDYKKRLEAGKGTVDRGEHEEEIGWSSKKKKLRAAAAFADKFTDFGTDCKFITGITPLIVEVISNMQNDLLMPHEAQSRSDWPLWQQAMDCKMKTLKDVGTWETVLHLPGRNIVGSKWVFHVNTRPMAVWTSTKHTS